MRDRDSADWTPPAAAAQEEDGAAALEAAEDEGINAFVVLSPSESSGQGRIALSEVSSFEELRSRAERRILEFMISCRFFAMIFSSWFCVYFFVLFVFFFVGTAGSVLSCHCYRYH